ncbi:MAG TPA: PP0621 family protein [Burkholderiales bacterium]|nr:PP0621 family protein [Burkholderiales bacterium]
MGRFILLVLALFLLIWLVRSALAGRARRDAQPPTGEGRGELVRCAHCGVHLPRSESLSAGGHQYCSEEHGRLGPRED